MSARRRHASGPAVSRIDEYLIRSLLSSDWELRQAKKLSIKPRGTMRVDWVRVWQK